MKPSALFPLFSIVGVGAIAACSTDSPDGRTRTLQQADTAGLGCFADSSNRDLSYFAYDNGDNTTESCIATCSAANYAYAGTQYGSQCFCGNSYGGQGSSNDCNMPCSGDGSETCGGSWANDVYATGANGSQASVTATPTSVAQGGAETVTVSNSDGGHADWVGLYAVGEPNTDGTSTWLYLNGTQQRPDTGLANATLNFTIPPALAPGQYEWRLEFDNGVSGYSLGATSPAITVTSQGGGLLPVGVSPPPGTHWNLVLDDEFTQDPSIRTDVWNGGAGNVPWCNGDCSFGGRYPGLNCGEYIFGTPEEFDPCGQHFDGVSLDGTNGLVLQPWENYDSLPSSEQDGYVNHTEGASAAMNTYGKFSQMYGYFEWVMKLPTDASGEGDGLHPDIWARTVDDPEDEVDVTEALLSPRNLNVVHPGIADCCGSGLGGLVMPTTSVGDLSANWHTYGLYWANDGSGPFGSMQFYVDGVAQTPQYTLNSQGAWAHGIYFFVSMDPGASYVQFWDSNTAGPQDTNSDPLVIRYMRAWQVASN